MRQDVYTFINSFVANTTVTAVVTGIPIALMVSMVSWVTTALQTGRSWDRFPIVSLEFFIDIILPAALWPSASERNEYQGYFLGVKAAGA
jgi:hypothetical protein